MNKTHAKVSFRALTVCLLSLVLLLSPMFTLTGLAGFQTAGSAFQDIQQFDPAHQKAVDLLAKLTPEERVGQLFVVTFDGTSVNEGTQAYDLIVKDHIGGLVLTRANDNFSAADDLRTEIYDLTSALQNAEWKSSQTLASNLTNKSQFYPQYIPLFIGISQEGDSYPYDQILNNLTSLPSQMSIGATWDPNLAEQAGEIMGQELSAEGFNFLLGPSLDVLDNPKGLGGNDLGVQSFGGDPYWVSKMGQAYISGLHKGSSSHLAVIAQHFPGQGSSDRSSDEEIATVRKTLDQLKQVELAPFFAVTGKSDSPDSVTDGMLVSHIRYQGFQSNIRATTRPVSLDTTALELILSQPELAPWRQNGGVMVSDDLGSMALRRFYGTNGVYDPIQAAREAFYAGNDLLYADHFVADNDPNSFTTIERALAFFAQKYRTDPEFARRVDAAVVRILTLKSRLYPAFTVTQVVPSSQELSLVGNSDQSQKLVTDVARQSVTLISPDPSEIVNVLPQPPGGLSRMIYLTDVQSGQQCSTCPESIAMPVNALQNAVLNFYGSRATGQVSHSLMSFYSFYDLMKMMNGTTTETNTNLEEDLRLADWVVVSILKINPNQPETQAFQQLLTNRPDLLANKKVVVFAFDAPYYLDATDISKITAYYALYSKTAPFVDIAARVLFQEIMPSGALPVSVAGVGYDLTQATSPDPNQHIPIFIDTSSITTTTTPTVVSTLEMTPALQTYGVKDIISLRTGVILDNNHNTVPDGTPVNFLITITTSTGTFNQQVDQVTLNGIARFSYRIDTAGVIDMHAVSGGAKSDSFHLDVSRGDAVPTFVVQVTQTPVPPTATSTQTSTPTQTVTPTPTATLVPIPEPTIEIKDWFLSVILLFGVTAGVSFLGIRREIARWGLRWALCGLIGGLLAYNYIALQLPGGASIIKDMGTNGILMVTFLGISIGWLVGLVWKALTPKSLLTSGRHSNSEKRAVTGPKSPS